jgi:hypothetical protein
LERRFCGPNTGTGVISVSFLSRVFIARSTHSQWRVVYSIERLYRRMCGNMVELRAISCAAAMISLLLFTPGVSAADAGLSDGKEMSAGVTKKPQIAAKPGSKAPPSKRKRKRKSHKYRSLTSPAPAAAAASSYSKDDGQAGDPAARSPGNQGAVRGKLPEPDANNMLYEESPYGSTDDHMRVSVARTYTQKSAPV